MCLFVCFLFREGTLVDWLLIGWLSRAPWISPSRGVNLLLENSEPFLETSFSYRTCNHFNEPNSDFVLSIFFLCDRCKWNLIFYIYSFSFFIWLFLLSLLLKLILLKLVLLLKLLLLLMADVTVFYFSNILLPVLLIIVNCNHYFDITMS